MSEQSENIQKMIESLKERAKELNCLYRVEELTNEPERSIEEVSRGILETIPSCWQFPEYCQASITIGDRVYQTPGFQQTPWMLTTDIVVQDQPVGNISVCYTREMPKADEGPFLSEEKRLIKTIADRIGHFVFYQQLRMMVGSWETARENLAKPQVEEWRVIIDLLRRTDKDLFLNIARKMLNYLCWNGVKEADKILQKLSSEEVAIEELISSGGNRPMQRQKVDDVVALSKEIFEVAGRHLPGNEILHFVQRWMHEDKSSFFIRTMVDLDSTLGDISDALLRFNHLYQQGIELSESTEKGMRVHLVRRLLSDQLEFIKVAKDYVEINDFVDLIPRLIYPPNSHGKIGGKGAGLFLACRILQRAAESRPELEDIKVPKTWFLTSDGLHNFMHHNNLEQVTEQKYKTIEQVRQEYPHIIQLFKNSRFPPEAVQGLSMALDDFGDVPLIVRSSSLLEDRLGTAFSGKYVSLFLANRGTKKERLDALLDAIAEVYASTFGADPIEYRAERGLIDFHEEMGVLIQEVVGKQVGKYYFPAYAGVVFSNNEFRWSPRIRREDGLLRLVVGLGTRAVDRLSDDYPVLIAPGQPNLRVNTSVDEIVRYSPNKMDLINLETNEFETVDVLQFLEEYGDHFGGVENIVSILTDSQIKPATRFSLDFEKDELIVTFDNLVQKTPFIKQIKSIVETLQTAMKTPVDIEFASDGENFYLLQCRPQSYSMDTTPAAIPKDIPPNAIVFTANRYISNGQVPDITHIVYVDPDYYSEIDNLKQLKDIGRVIGKLNMLLPKRQFILMGPGRWGSRGDIKLGVSVTYSDISNTAMLIEIAMKKGNYVPDLSFGTHFFQDLVESSIRYLPLYPDNKNVIFNREFLTRSRNILPEILPEHADLQDAIRVIDIPETTSGQVLRIFMNAELEEAVGLLTKSSGVKKSLPQSFYIKHEQQTEDHWRWRLRMTERIADHLDPERFGVKAFYVFGSTKNATAGPASDIDLLIHFDGDELQKKELLLWLEGWGRCLDEMNYLRTGYHSGSLIDVHLVTDEDIARRSSYAVKIGAVTDAAREIPLKKKLVEE